MLSLSPGRAREALPIEAVSHLSSAGLSRPVGKLPAAHLPDSVSEKPVRFPAARGRGAQRKSTGVGGLQSSPGPQLSGAAGSPFTGITFNGSWPPDSNIAVGRTYIVQVANTTLQVFKKDGTPLFTDSAGAPAPKSLSSLWANSTIPCGTQSWGDPIVQYDNLASDGRGDGGTGRWLITELGSSGAYSFPDTECFAVSQTDDPTGAYHLYSQTFSTYLNDYPKIGVWPTATNSAYLATYNMFLLGSWFADAELCAYDRAKMLAGAANPGAVCFGVSQPSFLPSDLDGSTPPADGTPGYFLDFDTTSSLRLYTISPDFSGTTPSGSLSTPVDIPVPAFTEACNNSGTLTCIPQAGTSQQLDSLGDRLMYRLAYRVFPTSKGGIDHVSMVVDQSVAVGSGSGATVGVRWYELQAQPGQPLNLFQYGTFAPDSDYRWMGSVAMDGNGDIALGYSKSSGAMHPSIAYTGRTPSMTLGQMGAESVLVSGAGSEMNCPQGLSCSRWGDYTAMRIDPSDDTTFWYTNEYYNTNSYSWSTAIASFTIDGSGGSSPPPPPPPSTTSLSLSENSLNLSRSSAGNNPTKLSVSVSAPSNNLETLSASGLPSNCSLDFSPASVSGTGASTITINLGPHGNKGTFSVVIAGTDQNNDATTATLNLTATR